MSNYEERMSKKYNFFSNEKDETDTNVNEPDAINETSWMKGAPKSYKVEPIKLPSDEGS